MGLCGEERTKSKIEEKDEVITRYKPIPLEILNKILKSICKITIISENGYNFGNGFFLNYSDSLKFLLTNYHVINQSLENENIEIEIHDKKVMKLEMKNRFCKYIEEPKEIAIIEIKESDGMYNDIDLLEYDLNYIKNGYSIYKDAEIFSVVNTFREGPIYKRGNIIKINNYGFEHNLANDYGSSGGPIFLLNNDVNLIRVIGIYKNGDKSRELPEGTFIAEIFQEDLNKLKAEEQNEKEILLSGIELSLINNDIKTIAIKEEELEELFKKYPPLNDGVIVKINGPIELMNLLYLGEWDFSKNVRYGRGIQYWKDGSKYYGYFTEDKANIKGKLIHNNGDIYQGEFLDDLPNGKGKYSYHDGTIYEGDWKNDK